MLHCRALDELGVDELAELLQAQGVPPEALRGAAIDGYRLARMTAAQLHGLPLTPLDCRRVESICTANAAFKQFARATSSFPTTVSICNLLQHSMGYAADVVARVRTGLLAHIAPHSTALPHASEDRAVSFLHWVQLWPLLSHDLSVPDVVGADVQRRPLQILSASTAGPVGLASWQQPSLALAKLERPAAKFELEHDRPQPTYSLMAEALAAALAGERAHTGDQIDSPQRSRSRTALRHTAAEPMMQHHGRPSHHAHQASPSAAATQRTSVRNVMTASTDLRRAAAPPIALVSSSTRMAQAGASQMPSALPARAVIGFQQGLRFAPSAPAIADAPSLASTPSHIPRHRPSSLRRALQARRMMDPRRLPRSRQQLQPAMPASFAVER